MARRHWPKLAVAIARDGSGIAAIEFALLLPAMLILFLGSFEAANLVLAYMKLEAAAETAADLVSQTRVNTVLQSADFTNFTDAAEQVLTPLPTSGNNQLKIAYASINYNSSSNKAVIDWHLEVNGATAISIVNDVAAGETLANLITETSGSTDSVIIVQLTYPYSSPTSYVLNSSYRLTETAFNRPRYMNCVPTYLNTGNTCP